MTRKRFLFLLLAICGLAMPIRAESIHSTLMEAQKQFEAAHYEQALKLYQQADQAEPGHAAIEYDIALCHLHLGDAEKAALHFEAVASRGDVNRLLQRDAFYNVGLIRARAAREQLRDLLAPATQPSDRKPAADDPESIPRLQAIADGLLRGIAGFRQSAEVEPSEDAEHNIRAARITRRDVLGLLHKAAETKQKDDILKDPRAYLETLILEQSRQASLGRLLAINPPADAARSRETRRAGLRAQRKLMENTGTLADNLAQFKDQAAPQPPNPPASAPSTQPAEQSPRERVYKAAAKQIEKAIEAQRQVCAFLLDNEIKPASEKQSAARDEMYAALYLFPLDPAQALVKARAEQTGLRKLVEDVKAKEDWLRDPLLAEAGPPKDFQCAGDKTPLYDSQTRVGTALAMLKRQCEYVSAASQPAGKPRPEAQKEPMLDPQLNRKLADTLKSTDDLEQRCLEAIKGQDQKAALSKQDELLKVIDAALDLLPKTLEQRVMQLIVRQATLNAEVQAEAGKPNNPSAGTTGAAIEEIRKLATRFKSKLLGIKPAKAAETLSDKQKSIRTETTAVDEEVRKKIPAGADATSNSAPQPTSQPAELKGYIEAAKHLTEAGNHMDAGVKGFEQAIVENSLKPMEPGEAVQTAQIKALEELVKALAALKPPATQPSRDNQDQKQQQQQQSRQSQDQNKQRDLERLDKERERAERELYQRRPRTVIKDW